MQSPSIYITEETTAFEKTKARNEAFEKLKLAFTSEPILGYPSSDVMDGFILDTDASNYHTGALLSQHQDGEEKVIAYGSKVVSTDMELLSHQKGTLGSSLFHSTHQALLSGTTLPVEDGSWSSNLALQF